MDKTSCQCLSPPRHPETGASSRGVALGACRWRGAGVRVDLRSPRLRQGLAGQDRRGRLPGGGGEPGSSSVATGLGVRGLGLRLDSHKGSDCVVSVALCP